MPTRPARTLEADTEAREGLIVAALNAVHTALKRGRDVPPTPVVKAALA
ncbi:MAG TPA: hypothetical protein VKZ50_08805 [bacterium]|nr:hypothetical protein [bacterium]